MRKKAISFALVLCMLITLIPFDSFAQASGTVSLKSLQYSQAAKQATADISGLTDDLKAVPLDTFWEKVTVDPKMPIGSIKAAAYVKYTSDSDKSDNYTTIKSDGTLDLSIPENVDNIFYIEIIVGNAEQLNSSDEKYDIAVTPYKSNLLSNIKVIATETGKTPAALTDVVTDKAAYNSSEKSLVYNTTVYPEPAADTTLALSFSANSPYEDYTAEVFSGEYTSVSAAQSSGKDVTAAVNTAAGTSAAFGNNYFTLVFTKEGAESISKIVNVPLTYRTDSFTANMTIENWGKYYGYHPMITAHNKLDCTFWLNSENVSASNAFSLEFTSAGSPASAVKTAVVDGGTDDVKAVLFDAAKGYSADYSSGHTFTITLDNGLVYEITVQTKAYTSTSEVYVPESTAAMDPAGDTNFQAKTAKADGKEITRYYVMSPSDDSLYGKNAHASQTIILNPDAPIDMSRLIPVFYVHVPNVHAYAPADGNASSPAVKQYSGTSVVDFSRGTVQYTACDSDANTIKNYWVTYVQTVKGKAQLFVNGPNFAADDAEPLTDDDKREVNLLSTSDYHDIFIANIGDTEITGLKVELDDAAQQNLKLDGYWTVGGGEAATNGTLPAFASTNNNNIAKIRLRLKDDPAKLSNYRIGGKVTISSTDGGTRVIYLTGAVSPRIVTASLNSGVLYVPYSAMIQTNNHDASNTITYTLAGGSLPSGMTLNKTTGELYGAPTARGTFNFTVRATGTIGEPSEKSYSLRIDENTDDNVAAQNDSAISQKVSDFSSAYSEQLFEVQHDYSEFNKCYIDGCELTLDTDYTVESGSTKITLRKQTFDRTGPGRHTIAAEFRSKDGRTMTKCVQNYTSRVPVASKTPAKSVFLPSSDSSTGVIPKPVTNTANGKTLLPAKAFSDVKTGDWFNSDVQWAYTNGYMNGVDSKAFAPASSISESMIVTVLYRLSGIKADNYSDTYPDIAEKAWYTNAAKWARSAKLIDESGFDSNAGLTRGQMAVMLKKYIDYTGLRYDTTESGSTFADEKDMSSEETAAFKTLKKLGIFNGCGDNKMDPKGTTSRAQFTALLHRLYNAYAATVQ